VWFVLVFYIAADEERVGVQPVDWSTKKLQDKSV
jgi:hypothetical protein